MEPWEIISLFQDPILAQKKAQECLDILKMATDDRDLENRLVRCIGYEQFDFLRVLRRYPSMILYCTLLAQAQSVQERAEVETKMRSDPKLSLILKQLRETNTSPDSVADERNRKANQRVTRLRVCSRLDYLSITYLTCAKILFLIRRVRRVMETGVMARLTMEEV